MVKIINPLGDVKIGRQGEVVYQRRYGQQTRRMVSPKRAIASQRQMDHRQLYRDALAWRKQLSLANRRYLEGYCIANWIVDGYNIPLAWSRFALKIYLQAVRFTVIEKAVPGVEGEKIRYEYNPEPFTTVTSITGIYWRGQTFTPQESHKIVSVKIKGWRTFTPGILIAGIRNTNGAGKPTGNDLCSGTIDANTFTLSSPGEWYEIELGDGYNLQADTLYAIVLRCPDTPPINTVNWAWSVDNPYPNGTSIYSQNGGGTWSVSTPNDASFEEYGTGPLTGAIPGLIHVRHPALLTVVHKRGGLLINGYDTLSSLDEEYLTKQVGLDVEVGDSIKATTLPGIEGDYLVR